jgi:hypothetical protein
MDTVHALNIYSTWVMLKSRLLTAVRDSVTDNSVTGVQVDKVALMFVTLIRTDNARITLPMEKIRQALVHNVSRSAGLWDSFKVYVDMDTPVDKLNDVAEAVRSHISANPQLFGGLYRVFFTKGIAQHKLELSVFFDFATNGTRLPLLYKPSVLSLVHFDQVPGISSIPRLGIPSRSWYTVQLQITDIDVEQKHSNRNVPVPRQSKLCPCSVDVILRISGPSQSERVADVVA